MIAERLGGLSAPGTFNGLKVYVQPDQPKMQLSQRVKEVLSPEFAAETDAWMRSFFGMTNLLPDGQYLLSEQFGFVSMNPRTYEQFRAVTGSQP